MLIYFFVSQIVLLVYDFIIMITPKDKNESNVIVTTTGLLD